MKSDRPDRNREDFTDKGRGNIIRGSHGASVVNKAVRDDENKAAKHGYDWIIKLAATLQIALHEKHAQEFLRVMLPHQPKTRVVRDQNGAYYVVSKAIPGFASIGEMIFNDLPPGTRPEQQAEIKRRIEDVNEWLKDKKDCKSSSLKKGNDAAAIGEIMIYCMKTYEIDLNLDNIGKNKQGKFVKIDGDQTYAFSENASGRKLKITTEIIDSLPFAYDYPARNWLDIKQGFQFNLWAKLVGGGEMKEFRSGVNRGLLKMLLYPDDIEARHTKYTITDDKCAQEMIAYDQEQKAAFEKAALRSKSFREYLFSPEAQVAKDEFLQNMENHKIKGKIKLIPDPVKTKQDVEAKFKSLQSAADILNPTRAKELELEAKMLEYETFVKNFLGPFSFVLLNHINHYTQKSAENAAVITLYNGIVNNPAADRVKMQGLIDVAKEAIKKAPKLGLGASLFKKIMVTHDMQELHHIIILFETKPADAIKKIRELRNDLVAAPDANLSATNSTTFTGPKGPGGERQL